MKKTLIIILQLTFYQVVFCQQIALYKTNDILLNINFSLGEYQIWEDNHVDVPVEKTNLSIGKVLLESNKITCIDANSNKHFYFKKLDKYRLLVLSSNPFYKNKEVICPIKISDKSGRVVERMNWKNGKKNGYWSLYSKQGVKFTLYKDGKIINISFKTHKEILLEASKQPASL